MTARLSDILSGIAFGVLSIAVYLIADRMPGSSGAFPKILADTLFLFSALLLSTALRRGADATSIFAGLRLRMMAVLALLWLFVVMIFPTLGLHAPGVVFITAVSWYLSGAERSARAVGKSLALGVGVIALFWLVFEIVLGVNLPSGPLF